MALFWHKEQTKNNAFIGLILKVLCGGFFTTGSATEQRGLLLVLFINFFLSIHRSNAPGNKEGEEEHG